MIDFVPYLTPYVTIEESNKAKYFEVLAPWLTQMKGKGIFPKLRSMGRLEALPIMHCE